MTRQFAFITLLVAYFSSAAFAADPWIGKEVFWKSGAKAKVNGSEITIQTVPFPAIVGKVNGDWLWLDKAWVHKDDVFSPDEAIAYWSEQIRKNPTAAQSWNNRGTMLKDRGELDPAVKDLSEAIRLDPAFAAAYVNRGNAWYEKGDFDNALKDYAVAMKLDPSNPNAHDAAAWLRATCPDSAFRDGSRAVTNATSACILSAWSDWSNIDTLAAAYAELGDFNSATKWQNKAIELASDDSDRADMRLRLSLFKQGKPYRDTLQD
jgi:tetratricopeptide (TPR) repeat protein